MTGSARETAFDGTPDVSIVIPCHQCAGTIRRSTRTLTNHMEALPFSWEIVLVDDGSTDGTTDILRALASRPGVEAVYLAENRGKGAAVARGMAHARGRFRIFTDADLPYDLEAIGACVQRLEEGSSAVFGNRRLGASDDHIQPLVRKAAGHLVRATVAAALGRSDLDTQCGFKGFAGPVADALFPLLEIDGFLFDVELCLLLSRAGVDIESIPVVLLNHDLSTVRFFATGIRTVAEAATLWRARRRSPTLARLRRLVEDAAD